MPNQAMGVYSELLLCPEKEFRVAPTDLTGKVLSLPFNSVSLASSQNTSDPGTITGRRDAVEAIYGNNDNAGDVVVPLDSRAFGHWLAFAFGSPTTTSAGAGKFKHVFKPGKTQPSAIIEKGFNNGVHLRSVGCKVSQLSFSFGGDGELTATASIVGCSETNEADALVETPKKIALRRYNNFQASLLIDGEAEQVATEVSVDIDFGLDTEGYAIGGNGYRVRVNEGIIRPSGNVTVFFDDASYLQRAENSTKTSLEVDLDSNGNKLQLMLPEVKFARSSPTIEGATGITQQLDYSAFYENNEQDSCVVFILTNDVESYAFEG